MGVAGNGAFCSGAVLRNSTLELPEDVRTNDQRRTANDFLSENSSIYCKIMLTLRSYCRNILC
jgi:hypothetical protein